ncbi:transposase [Collimonas antrihumi]|uniref:transposase n=1 Tax=Collimonas antrihumi TaxID=1940615 RepID=UPI001B8CD035|nr:transposase [Collimonas antrihumi]
MNNTNDTNNMQSHEMKIKDDQWQKLEPLLIGKPDDPGASARNNRLFIEAVLWIVLRKAAWRALPFHFGKSSTAYMRFRRWNECDFWRDLANHAHMDDESRLLLDQIVDYGDAYTARLKQRKARGERKIVYTSMMNATMNEAIGKAPAKRTSKAIDESTSHWVGLVTSQ